MPFCKSNNSSFGHVNWGYVMIMNSLSNDRIFQANYKTLRVLLSLSGSESGLNNLYSWFMSVGVYVRLYLNSSFECHVLGTGSGQSMWSFTARASVQSLRWIWPLGTRALPSSFTPLWPQACGWLFLTQRRRTASTHSPSESLYFTLDSPSFHNSSTTFPPLICPVSHTN